MKKKRIAKRITSGLVLFLLVAAVFGALVMLLWNAFIPALFNGPTISYWQAVGVLLLLHILLRGTPYYGLRARRIARRRRRFRERMDAMTREERTAVSDELGLNIDGS